MFEYFNMKAFRDFFLFFSLAYGPQHLSTSNYNNPLPDRANEYMAVHLATYFLRFVGFSI